MHTVQQILTYCWSSDNAFVSGTEGLRFKSRVGKIEHSVANSSPPLRHFFKRSCVARVQWRGHGPRELRGVAKALGAGFRGGTLYRPKNRWRPKKKKRSSLQNEFVFSSQVCNDPPKKGLRLPISGFSVSKKQTKTNGDTRGGPPP